MDWILDQIFFFNFIKNNYCDDWKNLNNIPTLHNSTALMLTFWLEVNISVVLELGKYLCLYEMYMEVIMVQGASCDLSNIKECEEC